MKKKKELSVAEKVAKIQERTAMYYLMLGVMEMPWFQKMMEKALEEQEKEVKEARTCRKVNVAR